MTKVKVLGFQENFPGEGKWVQLNGKTLQVPKKILIVLGQKKATNNFFDADHHFEPHKIEFKSFDQQSDVPMRGL